MERYYAELAAAYVRGTLRRADATLEDGLAAGLRLHKFKRNALPRVRRSLGMLRAVGVESALDIGSGRGAFLWPLLAEFDALRVTAIDCSERRVRDLAAVRRGGVERLTVARMDAQRLAFQPRSFDVVTILEVLEHLEDPLAALRGAVAAARRFVLLSAPSTPDRNPGHLRLFGFGELKELALRAGAASCSVEHVLNHRIALCRVTG